MNSPIKSERIASYFPDWLKWTSCGFFVLAIVLADWYFYDRSAQLRIAGNIFASVLVLLLISSTQKGKKFWFFAKETKTELRKVIWPKRSEIIQSTIMVIIAVFLTAAFLWGVDSLLLFVISFFTDQ